MREHVEEGLRYLALLDNRGRFVAEAGQPVGSGDGEVVSRNRQLEEIGGRLGSRRAR